MNPIRHHGWPCSPYSAKTRAALRYKGIDFDDHVPTVRELRGRIQSAVGRTIMPTLELSDGRWMQDSCVIIDWLDEIHPEPSLHPSTPRQRFAAHLLELLGDEWLIIVAMHTRWNRPRNRDFCVGDFGKCAMPGWPGFVQRVVGKKLAARMQAYLPKLGITEGVLPGIDAMLDTVLQGLEAHLAVHPYLFGGRASIADLALMGPLHAHVERDPDTTHLIEACPRVQDWLARVHAGEAPQGPWVTEDGVPPTLAPLLQICFTEVLPYISRVVDALNAWRSENPDAARPPRALGDTEFEIGGKTGSRRLISFVQWKTQRAMDWRASLSEGDRSTVDAWLEAQGGLAAIEAVRITQPMTREGLREVFAS